MSSAMTGTPAQQTISAALRHTAQRLPHAAAYIDAGRTYTWAEIDAVTDRIACGLLQQGFGAGDRLGLIGLNQVEWLQVFFAAAKIGAAVVGLSVRYRDGEIEYMLKDSGARAVFTLPQCDGFDFAALLERLRPRVGLGRVYSMGGEDSALAALARTPVDAAALERAAAGVGPEALAMIIYTSGTTGRPKGAALSHRSMLASAAAQAAHTAACPSDFVQLATPLNHVGGITCGVLTMLLAGGTCELVPAFKADAVLELIARRPPTWLTGVPTMYTLLLMQPRLAELDLRSVRLLIVGGSNVEDALLAKLRQRIPQATIMNLYGLSEASGALVMTPAACDPADLTASIGRALPGAELRVAAAAGVQAAADEVGELWFRGLGVIRGYVGAAAESDAFDAAGWLHTGDLGCVDARGFIRLKGRKKDMYIQGGFNVYPAEIEGLIARHPQVLMVAGIGVADPVLGEVGRYYVVPRPGSGLTEKDVRDWCAEHVADYKVPRQIVFRQELPLTPVGKIHKAALRDELKPA
jgi:fatty-acyl-CoA synthase